MLCIVFGSLAPSSLHAAWLLEAMLPGFKWLSVGSFVLASAGFLYATLYNYFARRAGREATSALTSARVA